MSLGADPIKYLMQSLINIERKYSLYQRKLFGVHYWKLIRFAVAQEIFQRVGGVDVPHPRLVQQRLTFRNMKRLLMLAFRHPFLAKKKGDVLLIPHSRKISGTDIYTNELRKTIKVNENIALEYTNEITMPEPDSYSWALIQVAAKIIKYIAAPLLKLFVPQNELDLVRSVRSALGEVGWETNLESLVLDRVIIFRVNEFAFRCLLKLKGIRKVFLVVSYGKEPLISAAHKEDIHVVELQHGVIHSCHPGYHFPYNEAVPYFPDEIYLFGEHWGKMVSIPENVTCTTYGAHHLVGLIKGVSVAQKKEQIVFLSQGPIGKNMLNIALKLSRRLDSWKVYFKLHPSELKSEYDNYMQEKLFVKNNIILVGQELNVYQLLKESMIQIGVSSTALFEGMILGCKTIVINMPGFVVMESAIMEGDALLVDRNNDIDDELLEKAPYCASPEKYFARCL